MDAPISQVTPENRSRAGFLILAAKEAAAALGRGVLAFVSALVCIALAGIATALVCVWILPAAWWKPLFAALVLLAFAAEAFFLGFKYALAAMIVVAVRRFRAAERILGLLFAAMKGTLGERSLGKVQRLPLRQAEDALQRVIAPLSGEDESAGFFRRHIIGWVHRRLVGLVALLTLAEFRRAESEEGGIDLDLARERLAVRIDQLVESRVLGGIRILVWLVMGLTVILALGLAVAARVSYAKQAASTAPAQTLSKPPAGAPPGAR